MALAGVFDNMLALRCVLSARTVARDLALMIAPRKHKLTIFCTK